MKRLWPAVAGYWARSAWLRAGAVTIGAVVALTALSWIVVKWGPTQLISTNGLKGNDRAEELGRVRTGLLALLAGSLAAVGAIYTARTFRLNRQGQITERFTRAVDQLGDE
jgi:hypothetical protein